MRYGRCMQASPICLTSDVAVSFLRDYNRAHWSIGATCVDDLRAKLQRLLSEAADCDIIGNLAPDKAQRDSFRKLASELRATARDIEAMIVARSKATDDAA